MDIFEFENYKIYLIKRIESLPKKGYGQMKRLATYLGVSSTLVSHVLQGDRNLNLEQAILVCDFFGLNDLESEYFMLLVQRERAGAVRLREALNKQMGRLRDQSKKVKSRISESKVLNDADKAIFYSDWHQMAVWLLTSLPNVNTVDKISSKIQLSHKAVSEILQFLVKVGLCVEKDGRFMLGESRTHVDAESAFIKLHHSNWRYKALELMKYPYPEKLHFTFPMTISKKDVEIVRAKILKFIEEINKVVDHSPSEELVCLNIDWFRVLPD